LSDVTASSVSGVASQKALPRPKDVGWPPSQDMGKPLKYHKKRSAGLPFRFFYVSLPQRL